MTDKFEVFEIDDAFDPLEDLATEEPEEPDTDYQLPVHTEDEAALRVQRDLDLPLEDRIKNLVKGMPGQKSRIYFTIGLCADAKTMDEIDEQLRTEYSTDLSVYSPDRMVVLLSEIGALTSEELPDENATDEAIAERPEQAEETGTFGDYADEEPGFMTVAQAPTLVYTAAPEALAFIAENSGESIIISMLNEEPHYLPIYRRMLEMAATAGGCTVKDYDAAIDPDPLCEDPRRFAGYFLNNLECTDAVRWVGAWVATEAGRSVLSSDILSN